MIKSNIANKDIIFNAINLDGIGKIVTVNTRDFQSLDQCLFQAFFLGGGEFPSPKQTYNVLPPNGCQIVCSKSFFSAGAKNYKYVTETFF